MSSLPCPAYRVLRLLAGKWKPAILFHLRAQTLRFGDLRRSLPGGARRCSPPSSRSWRATALSSALYPDVPPGWSTA